MLITLIELIHGKCHGPKNYSTECLENESDIGNIKVGLTGKFYLPLKHCSYLF